MTRLRALLIPLIALALAGCAMVPVPTPPVGELSVAMAAEPDSPLVGGEVSLIFTVAREGQPVEGARVLVVRRQIGVVHPDDDIIFESVELGGGRYSAATSFVAAGHWDIQAIVTPPLGEASSVNFQVEVASP